MGEDHDLLPTCEELGIAYVAYSPIGRGFLSAAIKSEADIAKENDSRRLQPRFNGENLVKNVALLGTLEEVAATNGCSAAKVAIAWLLAQGDNIFPIPGTTKSKHVAENVVASGIQLSPGDLELLDTGFKSEAISGTRYPPGHLSKVGL